MTVSFRKMTAHGSIIPSIRIKYYCNCYYLIIREEQQTAENKYAGRGVIHP
jgi:hypothetical protein